MRNELATEVINKCYRVCYVTETLSRKVQMRVEVKLASDMDVMPGRSFGKVL